MKRWIAYTLVGIVSLLSYIYGVATGYYKTFPFQIFRLLKSKFLTCYRKTGMSFYFINRNEDDILFDFNMLNDDYEHRIHFTDFGDEKSEVFFLQKKGGDNILIDCGREREGTQVVNYLACLGISRIDAIILTHYHGDHVGGIRSIVENFEIDMIVLPFQESELENEWEYVVNSSVENINKVRPNDISDINFHLDGELSIIGPSSNLRKSEVFANNDSCLNNLSTVLEFEAESLNVLFTSDIEFEGEMELLESRPNLTCDILKVSHHGRARATSSCFLKRVDPAHAVIAPDTQHPKEVQSTVDKIEIMTDANVHTLGKNDFIIFETQTSDMEIFTL